MKLNTQQTPKHTSVEDDNTIAMLDQEPTGAPMETRDRVFLLLTGIILPIAILIWGWV